MPVTPTYPGVYIEEVPSGVRTIVGVPTSITAFIGRAARGPENDPRIVNNYGDFERIFGGLGVNYPMSYAVADFFRNGGGQAIVVRLFSPTEAERTAAQPAADAAKAVADAATGADAAAAATAARDKAKTFTEEPASSAADTVATKAEEAAAVAGATAEAVQAAARVAAKPFTDAAAEVTARLAFDAQTAVAARDAAVATAEAATGADAAAAATAAREKAKTFTEEPASSAANTVATKAEEAAAVAPSTAATVQKAATAAVATAVKGALDADTPASPFTLRAAYKGSWGNTLRARVDHNVPPTSSLPAWVTAAGLSRDDLFNLAVQDTATGTTESFLSLTVAESPRRVDRVLEEQSRLVRLDVLPASRPTAHTDPDTSQERRNLWQDDGFSSGVKPAGRATDGQLLGDNVLAYTGSPEQKTGLYALQKADIFNMLCIPPDERDKSIPNDVATEALNYCVERRAMLILDSPDSWSDFEDAADEMRNGGAYGLAGIGARNAAVYYPRVTQADPLRDGLLDTFPPCGLIAGAIARTDVARGVWKAPAGVDVALNGTRGLAVNLTDEENGVLNPLGVNCLRTFPIIGRVVWGARTLRGADMLADEYKYLPVRRLALYIEESLFRGSKWVVFEPNDEPLWAQIRLNVGAFMHNLFRQGAFQGRTPREAYLVKCDSETTTQNDINLGIVNIVVGFAPLKPAEFVIIKIQQLAGQVEA